MLRRRRLTDGGEDIFKFVPAWAIFTPSMSKRNSAGPFAAGVMVQGKRDITGIGDDIGLLRGSEIKTGFFPVFDVNQGSLVLWITPEWNGNDGLEHYILTPSSAAPSLFKYSDNSLYFALLGVSNLVSVDVSSWVAGNTYCVVCRWDSKNKLDGTNYACLSINDVNSFGRTTSWTPSSPLASMFVAYSIYPSANAIIEGLTIYRRVLFDGTYGQDIGNGDELALIYTAGTGKDPTEITGSWDVVFCLPTNATAGALVTGTGEAWSHPHSSNLLKDGWLADGFYGGGKYVLKTGTPGNPGYLTIPDSAPIQNLLAGALTVDGWVRLDQDSAPYIFLWSKAKYFLYIDNTGVPGLYLDILTPGDTFTFFLLPNGMDGKWHHIACTFDNGGDQKPRIYFDGVLVSTGIAIPSGLVDDTGFNIDFGRFSALGWQRFSNSIRYSATFTPDRTPPAPDANTIGQWNMSEGSGSTVDNAEGTAARDGTISNGSWVTVWEDEGTPIVPESVVFNGINTAINCGNEASINNLPDGALSIDFWLNRESVAVDSYDNILTKAWSNAGLAVFTFGSMLVAEIKCATSNPQAIYTLPSGRVWHHYLITFDDAGDRKIRIFFDGVLVSTSVAGVGAIVDDSAFNLLISSPGNGIKGSMGWFRISNSIRYTANFIPPSRVAPPANDANTVRLFKMDEGTGTTITDSSTNAQNATLSNGSWNTVRDMAIDSPGARTYNWGHVLGSDAADEGEKQTFVGLTPGADYVIRALAYSEDGIGQPRLVVYDETNGAEISHLDAFGQQDNLVLNPGFDSGTSWNPDATWSIGSGVATHAAGTDGVIYQSVGALIVGKLYKVTVTISGHTTGNLNVWDGDSVITLIGNSNGTHSVTYRTATGGLYFYAGATFDGSIDNVICSLIPDEQHPEPLIFSFELPTVARAGVAADCVSMSVKLVNAASGGVVGWNQVELLANLIDNPSFDYGAVADPFIPDAWIGGGIDAGESAKETVIVHSSKSSMFLNVSAYDEAFYQLFSAASGKFFNSGASVKILGGDPALATPDIVRQSTADDPWNWTLPTLLWANVKRVGRSIGGAPRMYLRNVGGYGYFDDAYAFALDDVSLTATPASLANSQESGGIRVDGKDLLYQNIPTGKLKASTGEVKLKFTPRHSQANMLKYSDYYPFVVSVYGDISNNIIVHVVDSTKIRFKAVVGGVTYTVDSTLSTTFVAGTEYFIGIKYSPSSAYLYLNGSVVSSLAISPFMFSVIPTVMYLGSSGGISQIDAVFL